MEESHKFTLCHEDVAGATDSTRVLNCHTQDWPATYYLKNDAADVVPTASDHMNPEHSTARLDLYSTHAALSVYEDSDNGCWIIPRAADESPFRMPISTGSSRISVILRRSDHFSTSSGRWSVNREKAFIQHDEPHEPHRNDATVTIPVPNEMPPPPITKDLLDAVPSDKLSDDSRSLQSDNAGPPEVTELVNAPPQAPIDSQGLVNAEEGFLAAVRTAYRTGTDVQMVSALTVSDGYVAALDASSGISIYTACKTENLAPSAPASEKGPLKDISINLPSKEQADGASERKVSEQYHSIFGNGALPSTLYDSQPSEMAPASSASVDEWRDMASERADADHVGDVDMVPENDQIDLQEAATTNIVGGVATSTENILEKQGSKSRAGQKRKSRTNLRDYPTSSQKKRKGDEVSEASEVESNTIEVAAPVSVHKPKPSPVARKLSTKNVSKITAKGSPASSTRSHTLLGPSPDPTPSTRKNRSAASCNTYHGPSPQVIFSSTTTVDSKKNVMESFRSLGGSVAKSIKTANILCISSGPLKKTPKFVIAVSLGIEVVTENWLVQCYRENKLLDHTSFIPKDEEHEREWNFELQTAIERGKQGMSDLLEGIKIHFTRQLKIDLGSNFKDFRQIGAILGADDQGVSLPTEREDDDTVVIIGVNKDPEAVRVKALGRNLYTKDLLVLGVLRGVLNLESEEFLVDPPIKSEEDE